MKKKRYCLLTFEGADNVLVQKIADHMGIPMIHVVRMAIRFYAQNAPWPMKENGVREEVITLATTAGVKAKNGKPRRRAKV